MKNGDMPAAPSDFKWEDQQIGKSFHQMNSGLSKREYFAGLAMQGVLARGDENNGDKIIELSINAANALLKALEE